MSGPSTGINTAGGLGRLRKTSLGSAETTPFRTCSNQQSTTCAAWGGTFEPLEGVFPQPHRPGLAVAHRRAGREQMPVSFGGTRGNSSRFRTRPSVAGGRRAWWRGKGGQPAREGEDGRRQPGRECISRHKYLEIMVISQWSGSIAAEDAGAGAPFVVPTCDKWAETGLPRRNHPDERANSDILAVATRVPGARKHVKPCGPDASTAYPAAAQGYRFRDKMSGHALPQTSPLAPIARRNCRHLRCIHLPPFPLAILALPANHVRRQFDFIRCRSSARGCRPSPAHHGQGRQTRITDCRCRGPASDHRILKVLLPRRIDAKLP